MRWAPWTKFALLQVVAVGVGIGGMYWALPIAVLVSWPLTLLAGLVLWAKGTSRIKTSGAMVSGYAARVVVVFILAFISWVILFFILGLTFEDYSGVFSWELGSVPALATFSTGCLVYLGLSVFHLSVPPLERVRQILARSNTARVGLRASTDQVALAEQTLRLRLPRSFIDFLTTWGELELGATRIMGLGPSQMDPSSSSFVEATLAGRADLGLPQHLVVCASYPNDMHVCLDTFGMRGDEGPVVLWSGSTRTVAGTLAPTFGEFLRSQLETQAKV